MPPKELSPRENEIVELSMQGLSNEAIAKQLGLSPGTVNTYWLRIRMKIGAGGRTEAMIRLIEERAERALRHSHIPVKEVQTLVAEKEQSDSDLRAALELLNLAVDEVKWTVWATDCDLVIQIVAVGETPHLPQEKAWKPGKTVQEVFKADDLDDPAIVAHAEAIDGAETEIHLKGDFAHLVLRTMPLRDEDEEVIGCIGILSSPTK